MSNSLWFTSSTGIVEIEFRDVDQVYAMYHSGDCEDSVKEELPYFTEQLEKITEENKIAVLLETGWDEDELSDLSTEDINIKLLWVAAGDLYDSDMVQNENGIDN